MGIYTYTTLKISKSVEVVEGFLDTHIDMFVTYKSVEAVEDFLDIHIHHLKSANLWRLWRPFLEHIQTWTGNRHLWRLWRAFEKYTYTTLKIGKSVEVVEGFLDTHIAIIVTYTSVEDFLDIHIHHFRNHQICGGCGGLFRYRHTPL